MRRRAEFTATVRHGGRAATPLLVGHLAPPSGESAPRVGFVVGRAVGGAVERNRVRRRLRHLVRARFERLPAGSTLVLRATPAAASATSTRLAVDLDRVLDRLLRPRTAAR
jgi:ribonuclease P protein component